MPRLSWHVLVGCAVACACLGPARAGETLLKADFDTGSAVATVAAGDPAPDLAGGAAPTAAPGIAGQAIEVSAPERPLTYHARGNIDLRQGSLLFWLQPVDWDRDTDGFIPLLTIGSAKGYVIHYFFYFHRFPTGDRNLDFRARWDGKEYCLTDRETLQRSPQVLAKSEWTQIVLTWNGNQFMLYVNGEKGGEQTYGLPIARGEPAATDGIWFMPNPFWGEEPRPRRTTRLDEIEILSRALTPEEIAGRYRRIRFHDTTPIVREPLLLRAVTHAESNEIEVQWDLTGATDEGLAKAVAAGTAQGEALLLNTANGRRYGEGRFPIKLAEGSTRFAFNPLPAGKYEVRLRVNGGAKPLSKSVTFERPDPGFLTAQAGADRTIPAPWTPIKTSGREISVLNRSYAFDGHPFPAKMVSEGETVLARPPTLAVQRGGRSVAFGPGTETAAEQAPDRLITRGTTALADGSLKLDWRRTVAYDGLVACTLTLRPAQAGAKVPVDRLTFEAVVPMSAARFTFPYDAEWDKSGKVTARPDMAWVTNHRVGLCWFTDSDANWVVPEQTQPVTIAKRGEEAVIQATLIGRPVTIDKPVQYVLGLIATPTKPLRPDWRRIHAEGWRAVPGETLQSVCWMDSEGIQFTNRWLLGDLVDEAKGRQELADYAKVGIGCAPYACGSAMPTNNPIYDFYETQWEITHEGRPAPKDYRTLWRGREFYIGSVCPASGFADFMASATANFMRKYPFAGLYLDYGMPSRCDNPRHGCGVVDAFGQQRGSYCILAKRAMYERLYKVIHRAKPDGVLWTHNWLAFYPPTHSFTDLDFPGEEFMHTAPTNPNTYTDSVSAEKWQCDYNSHIRGVGIQFLSEVANSLEQMRDDARRSRPMLTCLLLHDVPCNGNRVHWGTIGRIWAIMDEQQATRADFHGYWETDCPVRATDPQVKVSVYTWSGERRALVIVGNMTGEPRPTRLELGKLVPARAIITARDEESRQPFDLAQPVALADRDFRIISLKW